MVLTSISVLLFKKTRYLQYGCHRFTSNLKLIISKISKYDQVKQVSWKTAVKSGTSNSIISLPYALVKKNIEHPHRCIEEAFYAITSKIIRVIQATLKDVIGLDTVCCLDQVL